jgi:superfamily II DNA/RNA helicase
MISFVHRILKSLLLTPEDVFSVNTFDELQLDARMVKNLADLAITQLTTIQARALPVILGGKDALVKSQTGSGKTLTYAVPIMQVIVVLFLLLYKDALVKSQTGSGKTLTYAIPIMQVILVLFLLAVLRIRCLFDPGNRDG